MVLLTESALTVIWNKFVDFFILSFDFVINDSRKKITNKALTCVQDQFEYCYINLVIVIIIVLVSMEIGFVYCA